MPSSLILRKQKQTDVDHNGSKIALTIMEIDVERCDLLLQELESIDSVQKGNFGDGNEIAIMLKMIRGLLRQILPHCIQEMTPEDVAHSGVSFIDEIWDTFMEVNSGFFRILKNRLDVDLVDLTGKPQKEKVQEAPGKSSKKR